MLIPRAEEAQLEKVCHCAWPKPAGRLQIRLRGEGRGEEPASSARHLTGTALPGGTQVLGDREAARQKYPLIIWGKKIPGRA